jgi:hypothetical protein
LPLLEGAPFDCGCGDQGIVLDFSGDPTPRGPVREDRPEGIVAPAEGQRPLPRGFPARRAKAFATGNRSGCTAPYHVRTYDVVRD